MIILKNTVPSWLLQYDYHVDAHRPGYLLKPESVLYENQVRLQILEWPRIIGYNLL